MEYEIARSNTIEGLEKEVRQLMMVEFYPHGNFVSVYGEKEVLFCQPMVRDKK